MSKKKKVENFVDLPEVERGNLDTVSVGQDVRIENPELFVILQEIGRIRFPKLNRSDESSFFAVSELGEDDPRVTNVPYSEEMVESIVRDIKFYYSTHIVLSRWEESDGSIYYKVADGAAKLQAIRQLTDKRLKGTYSIISIIDKSDHDEVYIIANNHENLDGNECMNDPRFALGREISLIKYKCVEKASEKYNSSEGEAMGLGLKENNLNIGKFIYYVHDSKVTGRPTRKGKGMEIYKKPLRRMDVITEMLKSNPITITPGFKKIYFGRFDFQITEEERETLAQALLDFYEYQKRLIHEQKRHLDLVRQDINIKPLFSSLWFRMFIADRVSGGMQLGKDLETVIRASWDAGRVLRDEIVFMVKTQKESYLRASLQRVKKAMKLALKKDRMLTDEEIAEFSVARGQVN